MYRNPLSGLTRIALAAGTVAATAIAVLVPSSANAVASTATCPQIDVITARGYGEPAGSPGGVLTPMVQGLQRSLPQTVGHYAVKFTPGGDMNAIVGATSVGVNDTIRHMIAKKKACPNVKFVLLGYSAGALVVGETLAPVNTRYTGVTTTALPSNLTSSVIGAAMFADGRFNAKDNLAYGSFDRNRSGMIARPANAFAARFGSRVANVCNYGDGVCQNGAGFNYWAHADYARYAGDLVGWIRSLQGS